MSRALDVAAAIIEAQHRRQNTVDKKQLQKLLYFVQSTHLVLWGERAFDEPLLAYQAGPVERTTEQAYRGAVSHWSQPIPAPLAANPIPDAVLETIEVVLDRLGSNTADELEAMTKLPNSPWVEARGSTPPRQPSSAVIPLARIRDWARSRHLGAEGAVLTDGARAAFDRIAAGDPTALADLGFRPDPRLSPVEG